MMGDASQLSEHERPVAARAIDAKLGRQRAAGMRRYVSRHCEGPMTGSATKQSRILIAALDCFALLAMRAPAV